MADGRVAILKARTKARRGAGGSGISTEGAAEPTPRPKKGATTKNQRRAAKAKAASEAGQASVPSDRRAIVVDEDKEGASRVKRSEDHYGPPVGVKTMVNDEWQTCLNTWEAMVPILGPRYRQKRIWQPFFYDGECCKHLRTLGFEKVTHSREDFFTKVKDKTFMETIDLIWDNPPYTNQDIKERVLRACEASGKPFCLLLPMSVLHAQFLRDVLDTSRVQSVIPRKVYVKKRNQDPLPFKYLVWLCYKAGLKKDLYLL